jgi:hypothetical protein
LKNWLLIGVISVLGLLHLVTVGDIADVLEVNAAYIFRVEDRGTMYL